MEQLPLDFNQCFEFSKRRAGETDTAIIRRMISNCAHVEIAAETDDRTGTDYFATMKSARRLRIDAKTRQPGCRKFWRTGEPELALERWSVMPCERVPNGAIGWTLDSSKTTDLVLYSWDPSDALDCYLLPFILLREAYIRFGAEWLIEWGPLKEQHSKNGSVEWYSACLFVPAFVVCRALAEVSMSVQRIPAQNEVSRRDDAALEGS